MKSLEQLVQLVQEFTEALEALEGECFDYDFWEVKEHYESEILRLTGVQVTL